MNTFPEELNVVNKESFCDLLFKENLKIMRNELYNFIINGNEQDFYDLDTFNRKYIKNINKTHEMVDILSNELKNLGWNTYLGFGGTGLYIYSTEEKPKNAW
jgi:hypothetical protein